MRQTYRSYLHLNQLPEPRVSPPTPGDRPITAIDIVDGFVIQADNADYLQALADAFAEAARQQRAAEPQPAGPPPWRRTYDCGACNFHIVDDTGDEGAEEFFDAVADHEANCRQEATV